MLFGSVLFACKQEIDLYEGESSIYFDDNYAGYYEVTWSTTDSDIKKMDIQLKVNLFGAVKDYPRKFNIQVISDTLVREWIILLSLWNTRCQLWLIIHISISSCYVRIHC